jgi:site-specific recombinase XerD
MRAPGRFRLSETDPPLLVDYAGHCVGLGLAPVSISNRLWHARAFLAAYPDLAAWMVRPADARLADLARSQAWPLVAFVVLSGQVRIDMDLLAAQRLGSLARSAEVVFPTGFAAVREAAGRLGWSPRWSQRVVRDGLPIVLAFAGKGPQQLTETDLDDFAGAVEATPMASASLRSACRNRMHALRQVLYKARVLDRPPPRRARRAAGGLAQRLEVVAPEIARVIAAYLDVRGTVLKPTSVAKLADNLVCFGQFLARRHPEVASLTSLERVHVEAFCVWVRTRSWRGRVARDRQVSVTVVRHGIIALRNFLDDIAAWGWADAPARRLVFASDIPREPEPLPRALAYDVDAALMAAVAGLDDAFAQAGLTVLRGAGLRIGELLDLELDCVVDYGAHGSWLRVPLGKLDTERSVPLDEATLAALDGWMAHRGP